MPVAEREKRPGKGKENEASSVEAACCIIIRENSILLLQRRDDETYEPPGGKIQAGETALQAAIREASEEACCDFRPTGRICTLRVNGRDNCRVTFFRGEIPDRQEPRVGKDEEDTFKWVGFVPFDELTNLKLAPGFRELLIRPANGNGQPVLRA